MWQYEKKLQYPVNIKNPNPKLAKVIISQLGGPDGELAASLRYLNQRFAMPYGEVKGLLMDIGVSVTKLHHYSIYTKRACSCDELTGTGSSHILSNSAVYWLPLPEVLYLSLTAGIYLSFTSRICP